MALKDLPRWLKLGIWFLVIYVVIAVFSRILILFDIPRLSAISLGILMVFSIPGALIAQFNLLQDSFYPALIVSAIIWFLIGALVGWIIGKIKSPKTISN